MKVHVIGIGLIGGSMALDIKSLHPDATIYGIDNNEINLGYLTGLCNMTDYSSISPNFQYSYEDGKIKFFSAQTTKNIWLEWWKDQRDSYKDSLRHSYKKMEFRKF